MSGRGDFDSIILKQGAHGSRKDGVCALEAIAWIMGEPHSDAPACVTVPELRRLVLGLNDLPWSSDAVRTEVLLPYLLPLAQASATWEQRLAVRHRIADIVVREILLDLAFKVGMYEGAEALKRLREIKDPESAGVALNLVLQLEGASGSRVEDGKPAFAAALCCLDDVRQPTPQTIHAAYLAVLVLAQHFKERDKVLAQWSRRLLDETLKVCSKKEK